LEPDDDTAFRKSGLSHMLAVSGTHLVFAVLGLVGACGALLVRWEALALSVEVRRLASFLGIPLALVYADFAGGSGSAWRAAWMLSFGFLARVANRAPNATRSLAASLLVGAAFGGLVAFDVSFLLSAAATVGLLSIGPGLAGPCRRLPSPQCCPVRRCSRSCHRSSRLRGCSPTCSLPPSARPWRCRSASATSS